MHLNKKCILCGSDKLSIFYNTKNTDLLICSDCEFIFSDPMPDSKTLNELYGKSYFICDSEEQMKYQDYHKEEKGIRKSSEKRLGWISKYINPPGKLLDIGCAAGYFMDTAVNHGWEVYGTDISEYCINFAKGNFKEIRPFYGPLKKHKFDDNFFDIITMWDVLEHLPDPLDEMKEVNRILKPGGILVIMTPNIKSMIAKVTGKKWILYQSPHIHLTYFSPDSSRLLIDKTGFEILKIKKFWHGGKHVEIRYALERMVIYSRIFKPLQWFFKISRLEKITPWLDIGDNMVIYARKKFPLVKP
jgi:2-polyprenyl-3-methyl-5-hydroxy-6-metoxy-1,4-benzoquinol methylase